MISKKVADLSRRLGEARRRELFVEHQPLAKVMSQWPLMRRLGLNQALFFARQHWPQFAGQALAEHTTPWSLKDGVLSVKADSPLYHQELTYALPRITRIAKDHLGEDMIQSVKVVRT